MNSSVMLSDSPDTFLPFWNNNNAFQYAKQSWTPGTAATAVLPRLSTLNNPNNSQASTVWLRSNDYFKLRNLEIGYEFPQKWMKEIGFRGAKGVFQGTESVYDQSRDGFHRSGNLQWLSCHSFVQYWTQSDVLTN